MRRFLTALTVLAVATGFATADIPIPPPQGKKFVDVKSTVKLETDVKGYVFYTRADAPGQMGAEPKKFEVGTKDAVQLPEWGRRPMDLFAVPQGVAAKYKTVKEWNDAIFNKKDGILRHTFPAQEAVAADDKRKQIDRAFAIQSVDAKDGIQVVEVKADGKTVQPQAEKKDKEEQASAGGTRRLVAGGALAAGVALAGLWVARRARTGR